MYHKDSPLTIQSMFNAIASRYDLTNSLLSFSLHQRWNNTLVRTILPPLQQSATLVDLCSGTGEIAFRFLRKMKAPCKAYLIDFSYEMLEHAKKKASASPPSPHEISYIEADVQKIPLPDEIADRVSIAYGVRNLQNPLGCFHEVFRILKPSCSVGILELTRPTSQILRFGHRLYLKTLLPLIGKWFTENRQAYQYLGKSIEKFIEPKEVEQLLKEAGFIEIQRLSLFGGIATLLIGKKG